MDRLNIKNTNIFTSIFHLLTNSETRLKFNFSRLHTPNNKIYSKKIFFKEQRILCFNSNTE